MANKIFETVELELQDGTVAEVKPLTVKKLRKFMEIVAQFEGNENDEAKNVDIMVDACAVALETSAPELVKDRDKLEDALDVPTMWKILEVAGGIKLDDPNLLAAVQAGKN